MAYMPFDYMINGAEIPGQPAWKKIKLEPYLTPSTGINSKCANRLRVHKPKSIEVPRKNVGEFFYNLRVKKPFPILTQKPQAIK